MPDRDFSLLREKWIRVMRRDGSVEELSMLDFFRNAHLYRGLAGELPTQDVAVLRVLLAVLHAVFAAYDPEGHFAELQSPGEALARWKALWERGSFPFDILEAYLAHFEDRFYLFHPERPFYQVPEMGKATEYTAAKLNGVLGESANKVRLFPARTGQAKEQLTYAEAVRWLIYINAFDDTSAKPSVRGASMPSPGAGWLGKLGLIIAAGDNLFETLMLNLVLARNEARAIWGEEKPTWEAKSPRTMERTEIPLPDNLSEMYTLQSRRLLLKREGAFVVGYLLLGGDFFPKENALSEQMTVWRVDAKKNPPEYLPRRHDPSRQMWRDFPALFAQSDMRVRPGIVDWLAELRRRELILRAQFRFQTAGVKYGDKDFFVDDVMSDSISLNAGLLTLLGEVWVGRIVSEIESVDLLADRIGQLAQNLAKAAGNADGGDQRRMAKEQAYYRLDRPFRAWLESIDPAVTQIDAACDAWWDEACTEARRLGAELVHRSGPKAFVGRTLTENKQSRRYTAPEAYNRFLYYTSNRQALKGGDGNGGRSKAGGAVRQAQD